MELIEFVCFTVDANLEIGFAELISSLIVQNSIFICIVHLEYIILAI